MLADALNKLQESIHGDREPGKKISDILLKAIETTGEMVLITDVPERIGEEKIVFVNKGFETTTQYSRDEVIGKSPALLQGPKTDPEVIDRLVRNLSADERFEGETFNYKKDGTPYRVRWSIDPIYNDEGKKTHYVSVQRDLTRDWEREQKMKEIIEERETLIKETHHRIKNNLATITGLLQLQIMNTGSQKVNDVLSESLNRVQSIASIHEKLYQTEGLNSIELSNYVHDLVDLLRQSTEDMSGNSDISFELDIAPISLNTTQAVPLGLIINELITNAQKHAFDETGGTISISCQKNEDTLTLQFSDNGRGLPEDTDKASTSSLGLKLIETFCSQLEADCAFRSDNGAHFELQCSIKD